MSSVTTIKVPKDLRDRLAARAERDHLTLGAVIAQVLDESEERAFWATVMAENSALSTTDRQGYVADGTLTDVTDPADDAVSLRHGW